MEIEIDLEKTLEQNAAQYFDKSKKARKKIDGAKKAIVETEKKLAIARKKAEVREKVLLKKRKRDWFEKFHWFYTGNGFLVVGGRDAHSNEYIVKKHMNEKDIYFHAEIFGAPHCVLKTEGKKPGKEDLIEAAVFAGTFSKAWQEGLAAVDVYSVSPEQVSKKAPSGEALGTGAFMIYGEKNWFKKSPLSIAIGIEKKESTARVISGPASAVKVHAVFFVELLQGKIEKNETAKKLKKLFDEKLGKNEFTIDDFVSMIPTGRFEIFLKK